MFIETPQKLNRPRQLSASPTDGQTYQLPSPDFGLAILCAAVCVVNYTPYRVFCPFVLPPSLLELYSDGDFEFQQSLGIIQLPPKAIKLRTEVK